MVKISELKKKLAPILKDDMPKTGELCLVWIAEVVAYAIVTKIEPFYMVGWYEFRFLTLRQLPPQEHEWRVKYEHLQGEEFTIDGHPACILALDLSSVLKADDSDVKEIKDPDVVSPKSWQEMIDERRKRDDDDSGGGCGNNCPSCDS